MARRGKFSPDRAIRGNRVKNMENIKPLNTINRYASIRLKRKDLKIGKAILLIRHTTEMVTEPSVPVGAFKTVRACRLIRKEALEFWQRARKWQITLLKHVNSPGFSRVILMLYISLVVALGDNRISRNYLPIFVRRVTLKTSLPLKNILNQTDLVRVAQQALRCVAWIAVPLALCGCNESILSPVGPIAEAERVILLNSLTIMLAIVVPTILATLAIAWWFRASNARANYLPRWSYSGRLELIIWSIPTLVILFLSGIAWIGSHDLDPALPLNSKVKPLEIDVVALDWRWLFIYPEQNIASINRLVAPVGVPVHLRITSATVLNVFFVPRVASEIYAMNGMATQLNLEVDKPGTYFGLSAHFSGDGFSDMSFDMNAVSATDFSAWADQSRKSGPVLDKAAYHGLLRQSRDKKSYTYRMVQTGLFDDIVMQKLPPGDGPPTNDTGEK